MLPSCAGVPLASRGFVETGKRICAPLCMELTMKPSSKEADRAVSAKVLMPLLDDKCSVLPRKLLGMRKLRHLQTDGLAQFDHKVNVKHCFPSGVADVNVDGPMFVAIEKELVTVCFQKFWA